MNKQEILESMRQMVSSGEISTNEILGLLSQNKSVTINQMAPVTTSPVEASHGFNYGKLLTYLGMLVVFTGIVLMFSQAWPDMGTFMRILVTLLLGIILYVSSILIANGSFNPLIM